jgi:hypothetical protein
VAGLLVAGGCGGPGDAAGSGPGASLEAADVHVVGTSASLADVRDLEVLPDGTVWVLNSIAPYLVGFGPDGTPLGAYGEAGGGPDELGLPAAFVTGPIDGRPWVLDLRRHAFVEVGGPDAPLVAHPLPRDQIPPGSVVVGRDMLTATVRTERLGSEVVVPRTDGALADGIYAFRLAILRPDLVALDPQTEGTRVVLALRDRLLDPSEGFERTEGGFPLWYRLWAVCGTDEIRVYDRVRNGMLGFTASGDTLASIPLPAPAFDRATPRQFARAMFSLAAVEAAGAVGTRLSPEDSTRLMGSILQRLDSTPEELAAYLPRYVDFRCSEEGTLWLRPFDLDAGGLRGTRTWLRIAADGETDRVDLPPRFDPYRFVGGRIWGVQRDALDVASVGWVEAPGG